MATKIGDSPNPPNPLIKTSPSIAPDGPDREKIASLINNHLQKNHPEKYKITPLGKQNKHILVLSLDHLDIPKIISHFIKNPKTSDETFNQLFRLAAKYCTNEIINQLLQTQKINDESIENALIFASERGRNEEVRNLLETCEIHPFAITMACAPLVREGFIETWIILMKDRRATELVDNSFLWEFNMNNTVHETLHKIMTKLLESFANELKKKKLAIRFISLHGVKTAINLLFLKERNSI